MKWYLSINCLAALVTAFALAGPAHAQDSVFDETRGLGTTVQPVQRQFEIFDAGNYDLTVTDLAVPAAAAAGTVKAALTRGSQVVTVVNAGSTGSFAATPGVYNVTVIGVPDTAAGIATVGVRIASAGTGVVALDFSDSLRRVGQDPGVNPRLLDATVDLVAGDYDVVLSDRNLPAALSTLTLAITRQGSSSLALRLGSAGTAILTASTGRYRLFAIGQSPSTATGGAFSLTIRARATGALVFGQSLPVGKTVRLGAVSLSAGDHTLAATDLLSPTALTGLSVLLVNGGETVAALNAAGTTNFTASAGNHELLAAASAAANSAGSYAVSLRRAGAEIYAVAHGVVGASSTISADEFPVDVITAGAYQIRVADFQFPQPLASLRSIIVQGGGVVSTLPSGGTAGVSLGAARATVLVFSSVVTPASGLYGVDLRPSAVGSGPLLEETRGVGGVFSARKVSILSNGAFDVTVADLAFPVAFTELAAVVTRSDQRVGSIFGAGTFRFDAQSGNYFINFIATPAAAAGFGTYRMAVSSRPPAPTVTLTADRTTVVSGSTVSLTWSSANAAACTASGAWSGNRVLAGNETTAPIVSSSTYSIECTGPGGSATARVVINTQAAASSSGSGGGGAVSPFLLLLVLAMALPGAAGLRRRSRGEQGFAGRRPSIVDHEGRRLFMQFFR